MRRTLLVVLALGLPLLWMRAFVPSYTNDGAVVRWDLSGTNTLVHTNVVNRTTSAIRFFLASDAYSATNTAAELNAVRASFGQWQAITGTWLKFEDAGLVNPPVDVSTADNTNVVYWTKSTTIVNGGRDNISGALGVAFTSFYSDGVLSEADIVFNGVEFAWFTDFSDTNNAGRFVELVALHEIGHFLGLQHSPLGGAVMLARSAALPANASGLSDDELGAARWLYTSTPPLTNWAVLKGLVTKAGEGGVFGATITVEDAAGNAIAGTVTSTNGGTQGTYEIRSLPPGTFKVRVSPVDPFTALALVSGADVSFDFLGADANFLASTNFQVVLTAGLTNTLDVVVTNATPPFRISRVRPPTANPLSYSLVNSPTSIRVGQSNMTVGVYSPDFTTNMTLSITGNGLSIGVTAFETNLFTINGSAMHLLSVPLSVSSNATPGMRTFVVQRGTNIAYANGFIEVAPAVPDFNFDGLDDVFQRRHFPLFTATNAAPAADPDGDTFNNLAEYTSGTDPTNADSLLRIETVRQDAAGCTITWQSGAGRRYQLTSKPLVATGSFTNVGGPITATTNLTSVLDPSGTNGIAFYRVLALP